MGTLRKKRQELQQMLSGDDWEKHIDEIAAGGKKNAGALFSLLLYEPELMHRAARALGRTVAAINKKEPDAARDLIRRFMWHMNEESANIGWGIPAAFAEALVADPELAKTYSRILNSYIMDLGIDDNFCDHDILRRTCYWAVGRLAEERPELVEPCRQWLVKGLNDTDIPCRGVAAWALGRLKPGLMDATALHKLASSGNQEECEIFDNGKMETHSVSEWAAKALARD